MKLKNQSVLVPIYVVCYLFYCISLLVFVLWSKLNFQDKDFYIYSILVFLLFFFLGLVAIIKMQKQKVAKWKIALTIGLLLVCCVITILTASIESGDYEYYLSVWYSTYQQGSIKDALNSIVEVSNYTPAYNYFLIILARLNINSLYGIKYITLLFSVLLSYSVTKLVSFIKKLDFNYLLFANIMFLPPILIEYAMWGQCDAIYTSFAILAFYFALKKRSKIAFVFLGLSFAFKLQFLFIVLNMFVLLIVKDRQSENLHYLKWKDIWIAPAMYLVNLIPLLFGTNIIDLLAIYFGQIGYNDVISFNCANLCYIYFALGVRNGSIIYNVLLISHIVLTFALLILLLIVIFRYNKKHILTNKDFVFFAFLFSFIMVFFMPKMLDRFYFITMALAIVMFSISDKVSEKAISILSISALSLTMIASGFTTFGLTVFASILNMFALIIFIVLLCLNYLKPSQNQANNLPESNLIEDIKIEENKNINDINEQ